MRLASQSGYARYATPLRAVAALCAGSLSLLLLLGHYPLTAMAGFACTWAAVKLRRTSSSQTKLGAGLCILLLASLAIQQEGAGSKAAPSPAGRSASHLHARAECPNHADEPRGHSMQLSEQDCYATSATAG